MKQSSPQLDMAVQQAGPIPNLLLKNPDMISLMQDCMVLMKDKHFCADSSGAGRDGGGGGGGDDA